MQLKVIKTDGTEEQYFHTKVMATFVNALCSSPVNSSVYAEELAEMVTYYLYNQRCGSVIRSAEILSIILATLSSTGYEHAAANLVTHHQSRTLKRSRVEVVKVNIQKFSDSLNKKISAEKKYLSLWDKTVIVNDLKAEYNFDMVTARTVASMVEEKVLDSGLRCLPGDFIKFLVVSQAEAILSAQRMLKSNSGEKTAADLSGSDTARDGRLRQSQNGLCPVAI